MFRYWFSDYYVNTRWSLVPKSNSSSFFWVINHSALIYLTFHPFLVFFRVRITIYVHIDQFWVGILFIKLLKKRVNLLPFPWWLSIHGMESCYYPIFLLSSWFYYLGNAFVIIEDFSRILIIDISIDQYCCATTIMLVLRVDLYAFHFVFLCYIDVFK